MRVNYSARIVCVALLAHFSSVSSFSAPSGPSNTGNGPPKGGPPADTRVQRVLDATFNTAFSALYLFDRSGMKDSSKNLRVLWTRALLDKQGRLDDPVAYKVRRFSQTVNISKP